MTTLYGIKNCDTMKKAMSWLNDKGVDYHFHDYKKDGLPDELLNTWLDELGFEALINKRGTTWRKLPDNIRDNIDRDTAKAVMLDNPSIIKRPLLDTGTQKILGFNADNYQDVFA